MVAVFRGSRDTGRDLSRRMLRTNDGETIGYALKLEAPENMLADDLYSNTP